MKEELPSNGSHGQGEYTVEQVAGIAAQLLKGNHSNHLKEAAQQALKLMDAPVNFFHLDNGRIITGDPGKQEGATRP